MSTGQDGRPDSAFPSRVGVWWNGEAWPIGEATEVARDIEQMGYGSLFFGEAFGKEALTQAGAFLTATDRLVVGTGIANIHARDPIASEVGGRTLVALHPGRFVLGLGVSHGPLVEEVGVGPTTSPWRRCVTTYDEWTKFPTNLSRVAGPSACSPLSGRR
jgi:alkanesulfonate monooxygenase SsuD/methylene tetrahydromethanopterin reductase-like flavin-dependent oxidoreductase (luciferase family)